MSVLLQMLVNATEAEGVHLAIKNKGGVQYLAEFIYCHYNSYFVNQAFYTMGSKNTLVQNKHERRRRRWRILEAVWQRQRLCSGHGERSSVPGLMLRWRLLLLH